jgi:hypothetical protein
MWQLMQTARMLEAEWRQVLQVSLSTGGKRKTSQVLDVFGLLDLPCYGPFSLGEYFETYKPFISLIFQFFFGLW